MTGHRSGDGGGALGRHVAVILRTGTLVAITFVAVGFVLGLVAGGPGPGGLPVLELLAGGGADAVTGIGLLLLAVLPAAVLGVSAASFAAAGERRYVLTSLVVLGLLAGSLAVAAAVAAPS